MQSAMHLTEPIRIKAKEKDTPMGFLCYKTTALVSSLGFLHDQYYR